MGTLASAWMKLQEVVANDSEIEPGTVLQNLNDTVVLFGQVINKVTYERRILILSGQNDIKQAKALVKDSLEDLNSGTKFLSGESFQKHIKATVNAQDSAEKFLAKTVTN